MMPLLPIPTRQSTAQAEHAARAALLCLGAHAGHPPVELRQGILVVGTRAEVQIRIVSSQVSRSHALLLCSDGTIFVRDLASRNHTFVNDRPVREARLNDGDELRIGPFQFRVSIEADVNAGSPPPLAPAAQLVGEDPASRFILKSRTALIGQRPECDLVLSGQEVSLAHAAVCEIEGRHVLRDLGARTGTFVNDQAVQEQELHFGDRIRIGQHVLRYAPQAALKPAVGRRPAKPHSTVGAALAAAAAPSELTAAEAAPTTPSAPGAPAPIAPAREQPLRRRTWPTLAAMLLCIALAGAAIWWMLPPQLTLEGEIAFASVESLSPVQQQQFQSRQEQALNKLGHLELQWRRLGPSLSLLLHWRTRQATDVAALNGVLESLYRESQPTTRPAETLRLRLQLAQMDVENLKQETNYLQRRVQDLSGELAVVAATTTAPAGAPTEADKKTTELDQASQRLAQLKPILKQKNEELAHLEATAAPPAVFALPPAPARIVDRQDDRGWWIAGATALIAVGFALVGGRAGRPSPRPSPGVPGEGEYRQRPLRRERSTTSHPAAESR